MVLVFSLISSERPSLIVNHDYQAAVKMYVIHEEMFTT